MYHLEQCEAIYFRNRNMFLFIKKILPADVGVINVCMFTHLHVVLVLQVTHCY